MSNGLSDVNSKNSEKVRNKQLKSREQDLLKREQECSEMVKQLAAIKAKVIQQEHLITELENSKKILETQLILSRRACVSAISTDTPATSSDQLVESKMMILEQRMHLLEMDCLRMRQEALRAEQLRALELQQNLVLGKQGEKTNPAQRSPNDWTYIQRQNPVQVMGLQQPQFMYANTSNRMEIPVIDPIGVSCQNQFLGQHGQTLVNGAGIGLMESSSPSGAAPTGQRPADVFSPEQNSTL